MGPEEGAAPHAAPPWEKPREFEGEAAVGTSVTRVPAWGSAGDPLEGREWQPHREPELGEPWEDTQPHVPGLREALTRTILYEAKPSSQHLHRAGLFVRCQEK